MKSNCVVLCEKADEMEPGLYEVTGTGNIVVRNTGGSSASEGGMGSGNKDDKEKGELKKPGEKSSESTADDDTSLDPIKKKVKEAEAKDGND